MTATDLRQQAIDTVQEIAALAATVTNPESPGADMLAILITAYSMTLAALIQQDFVTLEQALVGSQKDFDIVHEALREVDRKKRETPDV